MGNLKWKKIKFFHDFEEIFRIFGKQNVANLYATFRGTGKRHFRLILALFTLSRRNFIPFPGSSFENNEDQNPQS
jgi:hypothetical protein